MSFISNKVILYILILCTIDFTLSFPILYSAVKANEKFQPTFKAEARFTRQIVQPTWLNNDRESTIDSTVNVNPQSIFEAEEIRKIILKAVEEDTFVVTDEPQDTNNTIEESFSSTPPPVETSATHAGRGLPIWYIQMQKFWRNWTQNLLKSFRN